MRGSSSRNAALRGQQKFWHRDGLSSARDGLIAVMVWQTDKPIRLAINPIPTLIIKSSAIAGPGRLGSPFRGPRDCSDGTFVADNESFCSQEAQK